MRVTVAPIDDSQLYIEETENVINILSEPQGIALFYYVLTNLPEKYKYVTWL